MNYSLPRDAFEILVETFKSKEKAEKFAKVLEDIVNFSREKAKNEIVEKKELVKIELKDELKNELVTRELFEERFKSIEERFKGIEERFKMLDFKLNIFIALALIAITFANPTFVELIKQIFK